MAVGFGYVGFHCRFLLGLVALPLGSGLDKPQFLKWWLRIDFCFTLILALPVLFVCSESLPTTVAEDDEYIVYSDNGFIRQVTKSVFLKIPFQTCRRQEFITSSNN